MILLLALISLVALWYSDDVFDGMMYWILAGSALLLQVIVLGGIWYIRHQGRIAPGGIFTPGQVSIRSLVRGALAGDDNLAPPIPIPGASQAESQPDTVATTFRVTPPESRLLRRQQIMSGIGLVLSVAFVAMWALFIIVPQTLYITSVAPWQIPSLYFLLTISHGLQFVTMTRRMRSIQVEVRADGLHWGKNTLPWSEVRGWYIFAMNSVQLFNRRPNIIYAVVGEHASLTWITYPPYVRAGEPGQQLAQLVQTHVTVPLRDLVPGALRIMSDVSRQSLLRRPMLLAVNDWSFGESSLPRLPIAIVTFALTALILLGGILTPYAQQWFYGGQLTQMETATSHISDPLTANTLQWAPTSANAKNDFAFTPQGYAYQSTSCCDSSSLITRTMRDGLVEVTVHQQVDFDLNEAGIAFRANSDSNTMLIFAVTPNGEWHVNLRPKQGGGTESEYRSLRYEGLFGGISAIHQGLDATNRLAVLMQGATFTFFVNGQYVGRYVGNDLPQEGQVGVYVGGMNGPVTFSDLLLSPA